MYDFANSGYTTVVITAVFNAYFVSVVAGGASWATLAWTTTLAVSNACIIATAPLIGAYADVWAAKKRLLLLTTWGCVLTTAALYFAAPGTFWLAVVAVIASNFFFTTGQNLIAAFLPELAKTDTLGKVSGWGWSLGFVGGLITLGICLAYVSAAQSWGHTAEQFVPVTMLITALSFAIASTPTFLFLRERAIPQASDASRLAVVAWWRFATTLAEAHRFEDLRRFLACGMLYHAGIFAVISLAAIYAQEEMGFTTQQTLTLILAVNVTAAIGAFGFGYVQDRIGHVRAIALTLCGWIAMVLIAWRAESAGLFWLAANIAGLCMGASQSAGRAVVGILAPLSRRAEFFGLWGLAVNLAAIFGPLTYGFANWISNGDHRAAMLITGSYFVLGLALIRTVQIDRGRRAALLAEREDSLNAMAQR
jgi:UMF1 family MFS transporter